MRRIAVLSLVVGFLLVVLPGCLTPVGTSGFTVPSDAQNQCQSHCRSIGMSLSAVAIMANNVGCICQVSGHARSGLGSAVSAGMATIMIQQETQRQQGQQPPRR